MCNLKRTGEFLWTGGIYGCHNDHSNNNNRIINLSFFFPPRQDKTSLCSNIGPFINHVINISAVVAFYSLILFKMMLTSRHENIYIEKSRELKNISFTLFILTGAYIAFLTPILAFETCSPWETTAAATNKGVRAIIAGW